MCCLLSRTVERILDVVGEPVVVVVVVVESLHQHSMNSMPSCRRKSVCRFVVCRCVDLCWHCIQLDSRFQSVLGWSLMYMGIRRNRIHCVDPYLGEGEKKTVSLFVKRWESIR